jgi:hypothetical protein
MAILAELQSQQRTAEMRRAPRRTLRLAVCGATPDGPSSQVLVHDISVTGLLLETSADLHIGETIRVDLPEAGPARAVVKWKMGCVLGCQFRRQISAASVSAALLRSPFETSVADLGLSAQDDRAAPHSDGLSPTLKAWILVGLVVASWALVFAVSHWLF